MEISLKSAKLQLTGLSLLLVGIVVFSLNGRDAPLQGQVQPGTLPDWFDNAVLNCDDMAYENMWCSTEGCRGFVGKCEIDESMAGDLDEQGNEIQHPPSLICTCGG